MHRIASSDRDAIIHRWQVASDQVFTLGQSRRLVWLDMDEEEAGIVFCMRNLP